MLTGLLMIVPLNNLALNYAYNFMMVFVLASIFIQQNFIKFDSPKNLIIQNKMKEALESIKALYLTKSQDEAKEILDYLILNSYIERKSMNAVTVFFNKKYKKVSMILILNMFLIGMSGNFNITIGLKLLIPTLA
jgi:hypothetical protein